MSCRIAEILLVEFDVNLLAASCLPFSVQGVDSRWLVIILEFVIWKIFYVFRAMHGKVSQVDLFTAVSSSLVWPRMLYISVGILLLKSIIISMEITLQFALSWSSSIDWTLAADLVIPNKRESTKLGLIPPVDQKLLESCEIYTHENQARFFHGSWRKFYIGLVDLDK